MVARRVGGDYTGPGSYIGQTQYLWAASSVDEQEE